MSSDEIQERIYKEIQEKQKQIYKEVIARKQDFLNKMDELNNSGIQNILEQDKKYLLICKDPKIETIVGPPDTGHKINVNNIFYINIVKNLYLTRVVQPTCNEFVNYDEAINKFKDRLKNTNKTYYLSLSESIIEPKDIISRDNYYVISSFLKAGEVKEKIDHHPYLSTFFTEIDENKTLKDMSDFDIMRNLWVVNEKINKINTITWVDNEKINRILDHGYPDKGGKPKLFRLYNLTGKRKSKKSRKSRKTNKKSSKKSKKSRKSRKTRKSKKK